MIPKLSILNPEFRYIKSYETDISKRFDKIRESQQVTLTQSISDRAAVERNFADRRRMQIEAEDDRR